jgi:hypothetical protein
MKFSHQVTAIHVHPDAVPLAQLELAERLVLLEHLAQQALKAIQVHKVLPVLLDQQEEEQELQAPQVRRVRQVLRVPLVLLEDPQVTQDLQVQQVLLVPQDPRVHLALLELEPQVLLVQWVPLGQRDQPVQMALLVMRELQDLPVR